MSTQQNLLLAMIERAGIENLRPYLSIVQLQSEQVLAETQRPVQKVYFPHSGIISCVVELIGGSAITTGMIGRDGAFGALQALDGWLSLNLVVVQIPGIASVIDAAHLVKAAEAQPALRRILLKYDQFVLAQVQQTAACNALHSVQMRTCKWLLRMQELAGSDFPVTQEFLAQMMGVRRTSVTEVASNMQKAGMISYNRGHVRLIAIEKIKSRSCECHEHIRSQYHRIFDENDGGSATSTVRSSTAPP
jgi:CRP-like cAMP-binding protein